MTEAKFQSNAIKWLRDQGAYVIKLRAAPGVPVGAPDILALYLNRWAVIECKKDAAAPFRVGQQPTLQYLKKGNTYVYVAYPENWSIIKADLLTSFFSKSLVSDDTINL